MYSGYGEADTSSGVLPCTSSDLQTVSVQVSDTRREKVWVYLYNVARAVPVHISFLVGKDPVACAKNCRAFTELGWPLSYRAFLLFVRSRIGGDAAQTLNLTPEHTVSTLIDGLSSDLRRASYQFRSNADEKKHRTNMAKLEIIQKRL